MEKFGGENTRLPHGSGIRTEFTPFLERMVRVNCALAALALGIMKIRSARRGRRMMRKRKNATA